LSGLIISIFAMGFPSIPFRAGRHSPARRRETLAPPLEGERRLGFAERAAF
jgi:hypothetical protein